MAATGSPTPLSRMKFEEALAELEALVHNMEEGKLELEASLAAYQRGMALLQHCQEKLAAAEQKLEIVERGSPPKNRQREDSPP